MVATFIVFILIFAILALVYHLFYAAPISAHPLNFVHGNETYEGYGLTLNWDAEASVFSFLS